MSISPTTNTVLVRNFSEVSAAANRINKKLDQLGKNGKGIEIIRADHTKLSDVIKKIDRLPLEERFYKGHIRLEKKLQRIDQRIHKIENPPPVPVKKSLLSNWTWTQLGKWGLIAGGVAVASPQLVQVAAKVPVIVSTVWQVKSVIGQVASFVTGTIDLGTTGLGWVGRGIGLIRSGFQYAGVNTPANPVTDVESTGLGVQVLSTAWGISKAFSWVFGSKTALVTTVAPLIVSAGFAVGPEITPENLAAAKDKIVETGKHLAEKAVNFTADAIGTIQNGTLPDAIGHFKGRVYNVSTAAIGAFRNATLDLCKKVIEFGSTIRQEYPQIEQGAEAAKDALVATGNAVASAPSAAHRVYEVYSEHNIVSPIATAGSFVGIYRGAGWVINNVGLIFAKLVSILTSVKAKMPTKTGAVVYLAAGAIASTAAPAIKEEVSNLAIPETVKEWLPLSGIIATVSSVAMGAFRYIRSARAATIPTSWF